MSELEMVHPCPWNRDKGVGWGIGFGYVRGYPGGYHFGLDFYAPTGQPILAAAFGVVHEVDDVDDSAYGKNITLYHGVDAEDREIYTVYAHLHEIQVEVDQEVQAGEQIGTCGHTGNTTGGNSPHLHFEVRHGDNAKKFCVDPLEWIKPRPEPYAKAMHRWK